MTTVAIVDDHSVVRIGMKYVIMTDREFKFVGEADDGAEAVSLVEKVHPDILLLDVRMPGTGGIAALKSVREKFPDQKVVMLTMSDAEEDVYQAITLGARGYVIKDNSPVNIIGALKKVMAGELAVSDAVRSAYEARKSERGLTGRSHGTREGDTCACEQGMLQCRDRRHPPSQPQHGEEPPEEPLRVARCRRPRGGGRDRHPPRAHLVTRAGLVAQC